MKFKIPRAEFERIFSRSSGPGGQNVNKLNSKATIRLQQGKWSRADWIPEAARAQLYDKSFKYITKSGDLLVQSSRSRSQAANLDDCFRKLEAALEDAAFTPAETSQEARSKWTAISKAERAKALQTKRIHSQKKANRREIV